MQDERVDPAGSRQRLVSAVTWLRNNRRGERYPILNGENAAYGFRRNLYGAKPIGVAISLACMGTNAGLAWVAIAQSSAPTLIDALNGIAPEVLIGFLVALAWLCAWLTLVTPTWVRESAELYAKALLETCDGPAP